MYHCTICHTDVDYGHNCGGEPTICGPKCRTNEVNLMIEIGRLRQSMAHIMEMARVGTHKKEKPELITTLATIHSEAFEVLNAK